jgi:hypothetical protein
MLPHTKPNKKIDKAITNRNDEKDSAVYHRSPHFLVPIMHRLPTANYDCDGCVDCSAATP